MKRRDFLTTSVAAAGAGIIGCAGSKQLPQSRQTSQQLQLWREIAPFHPKPQGSMTYSELGNTGIRISKYGFGSHIRAEMRDHDYQREYIIHEAVDLGVNVFDVYDEEEGVSTGGSFQYEPFGKQIKPYVNDVLISISFRPGRGRTQEQEFERALRLFGRDHIDLVRLLRRPEDPMYEFLFKKKEEGHIRAIGAPIHTMRDVDSVLGIVPLDYMLIPYNFYHNICWLGDPPHDFTALPARLRQQGVGLMTMKPFGGDYLVQPFINVGKSHLKEPEISFPISALKYVINSGIDAATTLTGMYNLPHLYENVAAYYNPEMTPEEKALLDNIRNSVVDRTQSWLPDHYKWLDDWAPERKHA